MSNPRTLDMRIARRRSVRLGFAAPALLLLSACAKQGISPDGQDIHQLYTVIMAIALPVFVVVEALLIWCVVRYRRRDDAPPAQTRGGNRSLAVFFAIPAVIVATLFPFGEQELMRLQDQPAPQVKIRVEGFQWEWTFLYLNEGIFEAGKTLVRPAVMVLPVGQPVQIELTSRDVIHSFFVPDLLFKRDAIPGRTSTFTFTPTKLGTFHAQCAEFCGLWHSRMTFEVQVVPAVDYQAWIEKQRKEAAGVTCAPNGTALALVAKDIAWDQHCLAVPADTSFTISVTNQDAGIEHNVSIYDSFFEETNYFTAPKITGPSSQTFDVGALPAGRYYFQCDVHGPSMSGAFIVAGATT